MPRFDVHLYPIAVVLVRGIEADSPSEAGCIACGQMRDALIHRFRRLKIDFDGEYAAFLVDVEGDGEFTQSRFFHNAEQPLLGLIRRFVEWHDSDQADSPQLSELLEEARDELAHSA